MSKLAICSHDALLDIATWTFEQHCFQGACHSLTVLRVDACQIFVTGWGSVRRIETANPEQLRRPIVKETGGVEGPASDASKSLPFGEIKLASLLGTLTREENAVCILQGNRPQLPVLVVIPRH
jgi:hypothetical protein